MRREKKHSSPVLPFRFFEYVLLPNVKMNMILPLTRSSDEIYIFTAVLFGTLYHLAVSNHLSGPHLLFQLPLLLSIMHQLNNI